jgi:arginyl-tRNA synthetase
MNVLAELRSRFAKALAPLVENPRELAQMVRTSQDARFGDYQANCAMPLGKKLGKPPREVAAELIQTLDLSDICHEPEIAGPGFINLRLRNEWISAQLAASAEIAQPRSAPVDAKSDAKSDPKSSEPSDQEDRLGVPVVEHPRTFVIDYSAPNVAKPMHVGHIRSTVIGAALANITRFLGHRVITDNHIGDWGTQFGMILYGYRHFRDDAAYKKASVTELARLYRLVNQLIGYHAALARRPEIQAEIRQQEQLVQELDQQGKTGDTPQQKRTAKELRRQKGRIAELLSEADAAEATILQVEQDDQLRKLAEEHPDVQKAALRETALLHEGDAERRALWEEFLPACRREIDVVYDRLKVQFDEALGESFYHDALAGVVDELASKQLARESEGAMCVFLPGHDAPLIVRKQDGAFLYATTDLATIQYRMAIWHPDVILYVVDHRQSLHFEQLFATARLWGYDEVELRHISFGTVLGEDNRPFKTRGGDTVGLESLLDEAVRRARAVVAENDDSKPDGPELDDAERDRIAEAVGIGAIKYADLSHNRTSDYVFSYDKMLAMRGNTATYLQYAYTRVRSIFQRSGLGSPTADRERLAPERDAAQATDLGFLLQADVEAQRALMISLLGFGDMLDDVMVEYRPNLLTAYLFELANQFATFYDSCPVLKAEDARTRRGRLLLCDLTARTLNRGLALLGIDVVERM